MTTEDLVVAEELDPVDPVLEILRSAKLNPNDLIPMIQVLENSHYLVLIIGILSKLENEGHLLVFKGVCETFIYGSFHLHPVKTVFVFE